MVTSTVILANKNDTISFKFEVRKPSLKKPVIARTTDENYEDYVIDADRVRIIGKVVK